jgi:hypothetical protein
MWRCVRLVVLNELLVVINIDPIFLAANPEVLGWIYGACQIFLIAVRLEWDPLSPCEDK